jgi:transposase
MVGEPIQLFSADKESEHKEGMRARWEVTDAQWKLVEPILRPQRRADGRGRPWQDTRAVLYGILWVLGTGAQWRELPQTYPPYQTCHRRFQQWVRAGKLERVLRVLAEELQARGKLNPEEAFIDASFTGAKKGASGSGLPNAARGRKSLFSPMITVFLSLLVSKALRRTKANLSKGSSGTVSSTPSQRD